MVKRKWKILVRIETFITFKSCLLKRVIQRENEHEYQKNINIQYELLIFNGCSSSYDKLQK